MENEGSFIRWQAITINQLSLATNVILTFTAALIGFEINYLLGNDFSIRNSVGKLFYLGSLIIFAFSFFIGIYIITNRLKDFRKSARIARIRENKELALNIKKQKIDNLKIETRKLGKRTKNLFRWQIYTFILGILLGVLSILENVWEILL